MSRPGAAGSCIIKLLGDLPVGSTSLEEARQAARYLSKYGGKAFDERRIPGLHRYELAQGYAPVATRLYGRTADQVLAEACQVMGSEPARVWSSAETPGWDKPPAVWASWN